MQSQQKLNIESTSPIFSHTFSSYYQKLLSFFGDESKIMGRLSLLGIFNVTVNEAQFKVNRLSRFTKINNVYL